MAEGKYDDLVPAFEIWIEGSRIGGDLSMLVTSVEYESSDGIADEMRVVFANPEYKLSNSTLWRQGNQLDLWIGYGKNLVHIGRGIIARPSPKYVRDGMPTIEITAYSKDFLMMENKPAPQLKERKARGKKAAEQTRDIRNFQKYLVTDSALEVASRPAYRFDLIDIDEMERPRYSNAQKADITDYQYVKGLANSIGWLFWVDYAPESGWVFHFRDPKKTRVQDRVYTFEHYNGNKSTLLDFEPELSLTGSVSTLQVQCRDTDSNETLIDEFTDDQTAPDSRYRGNPEERIDETVTTAGAVVRLFFGDHFVDVVSDRQFRTNAELRVWAEQWWRRKRENFVVGRGTVVGLPDLRARQVHTLKLPDVSLSGDYYFARVRHTFGENGYLVDFSARKLVSSW